VQGTCTEEVEAGLPGGAGKGLVDDGAGYGHDKLSDVEEG
jgi:hypothetical protein